jgi:hypothetical protein
MAKDSDGPRELKRATIPSRSVAPTVMAEGAMPGDCTLP